MSGIICLLRVRRESILQMRHTCRICFWVGTLALTRVCSIGAFASQHWRHGNLEWDWYTTDTLFCPSEIWPTVYSQLFTRPWRRVSVPSEFAHFYIKFRGRRVSWLSTIRPERLVFLESVRPESRSPNVSSLDMFLLLTRSALSRA